jgi:hypothetical protein
VRTPVALVAAALLAGCATAWEPSGSLHRALPVPLTVESRPPGARVFLDGRALGETPLSAVLDCEEEIARTTRRVSYWVTQPGLALLLSAASLGVYLPFSLIPVDPETAEERTGRLRPREFALRIEAERHRPWTSTVACGSAVTVRAVLDPA